MPFKVDMGIYIDNMTATMLLMVTGVATLIHIFSTYYMHDNQSANLSVNIEYSVGKVGINRRVMHKDNSIVKVRCLAHRLSTG